MNCANIFTSWSTPQKSLFCALPTAWLKPVPTGSMKTMSVLSSRELALSSSLYGAGGVNGVVGIDDAARTEGAHVQPDGGGAGAAVVDEGDGALAEILHVAAGVGGGINQRGGFAFVVFQERGRGGGFVGDGLTVDVDGVVGGPGFFLGRIGLGGFGVCLRRRAWHLCWVLALLRAWLADRRSSATAQMREETSSFALRSVDFAPQLSRRDSTQAS